MGKTFIFDLDDTLIPNHHYYAHAQLDFTRWVMEKVGHRGPDAHYILNLQVDTDYNSVKLSGFGMDRFPDSFAITYQTICEQMKIDCTEEDMEEARNIARKTFDPENYRKRGLFAGVEETLDFLTLQGDELILITKGDPKAQEPKIKINNLPLWFGSNIHIVPTKNPEILQHYVGNRPLKSVWLVGNSYGSDIVPALELGAGSIYIPCETWVFEREKKTVKIPENSRLFTFDEVSDIIKNYSLL